MIQNRRIPVLRWLTLLALTLTVATLAPVTRAFAQGVTTAQMSGVVKDPQGAVIPGATVTAVHQPSGSTYETSSPDVICVSVDPSMLTMRRLNAGGYGNVLPLEEL